MKNFKRADELYVFLKKNNWRHVLGGPKLIIFLFLQIKCKILKSSVGGPYVFGPPGSGSVIILDPDPSIIKQKSKKTLDLHNFVILSATDEKSRIRIRKTAGTDPRIWIRTKISWIHTITEKALIFFPGL